MNLEEFKKAAPHALLRDAEACEVLKVTGMSAEKILLHKLEGGGPGIATVEDLATEHFYKVGPNVRRLADLIGGKKKTRTFAEGMCCFVCTCFHSRSLSDRARAHAPEDEVGESDS